MRKRVILLFSIVPFLIGFLFASAQGKPAQQNQQEIFTKNIPSTDTIILVEHGDIYKLSSSGNLQITHNQNLIEPILVGNTFVGIDKETNFATMNEFDSSGTLQQRLFNGNSGNIDTMSWISDPSVNNSQSRIAYVSDKDKGLTHIPDNALYVMNVSNGRSTNVVKPVAYTGGLAHPIFNPKDEAIILYDYYQYDPQTLIPYSTIEQYSSQTGVITTLTYENKNAYQEAFSPDGTQVMFLGRNDSLNTVSLFMANYSPTGLTNDHLLSTGDFAYPVFSQTMYHIYFLKAEGNNGFDLYTATLQSNKLVNMLPITSGMQLLGNSSYEVLQNSN